MFIFSETVLGGEIIEDKIAMATDAKSEHLFTQNPAILPTDKTYYGLVQTTSSRKYSVLASPNI